MTLQEAIKSKKRFRNSNFLNGIWIGSSESWTLDNKDKWDTKSLSISDVLSNDWEIEEKSITITKSQFLDKVTFVMKQIAKENTHFLCVREVQLMNLTKLKLLLDGLN